jgi:hypothetical protein
MALSAALSSLAAFAKAVKLLGRAASTCSPVEGG